MFIIEMIYRRNITLAVLLSLPLYLMTCSPHSEKQKLPAKRPNVLLIFTDQQNSSMMSAAGNPYVQTPNMDRLAREGILFTQSYCTSPVCGPARSSIITGRMPHETGVEWNGDEMHADVENVGEIFRSAGYHTVWAGKWHLPESYPQRNASKQKEIKGFDMLPFYDPEAQHWMLGAETDPPLTDAVVGFLDKYDDEKPFFLAVSYHNPHDICFYPRKAGWFTDGDSLLEIRHYGFEYRLPDVIGTHPDFISDLPSLPANYNMEADEPGFLTEKRMHHDEYGVETKLSSQEFTEKEWRGYYHAYCRLTEMVDREIGKVLGALQSKGYDENTIVIFTSDHGDGAASHQWAAKLSLYEESSKIPFIIAWRGHIPAGRKDSLHLISQIDIVPTLCDYAGIAPEISFTGRSLRPVIEDPGTGWRDFLVVELADYKPDRSRKGRMIRTPNFKYNVYTHGERNEQFFDLVSDPGEMKNLIDDGGSRNEIDRHRQLLERWMLMTRDPVNF